MVRTIRGVSARIKAKTTAGVSPANMVQYSCGIRTAATAMALRTANTGVAREERLRNSSATDVNLRQRLAHQFRMLLPQFGLAVHLPSQDGSIDDGIDIAVRLNRRRDHRPSGGRRQHGDPATGNEMPQRGDPGSRLPRPPHRAEHRGDRPLQTRIRIGREGNHVADRPKMNRPTPSIKLPMICNIPRHRARPSLTA